MPVIFIALFVMLIVFMPCFVIWSLNTLFLFHIPYGVPQYFASLVLIFDVGGFKIKL